MARNKEGTSPHTVIRLVRGQANTWMEPDRERLRRTLAWFVWLDEEQQRRFIRTWEDKTARIPNFGWGGLFELLGTAAEKWPEILRNDDLKRKERGNGHVQVQPEYEKIRPAVKIKDPPEWFCWACRRWHTSPEEPDTCPNCGESLRDGGPRVAGWHGRRAI